MEDIETPFVCFVKLKLAPRLRVASSAVQVGRVELDVIVDEVVDEEIAVVVVLVPIDGESVTIGVEGFNQIRPAKRLNELVLRRHVHVARRQRQRTALRVEDLDDGVIGAGFDTPHKRGECPLRKLIALCWVADRRKCCHTPVALRQFGGADQGTIPSHAEACDGAALAVNVEISLDKVG